MESSTLFELNEYVRRVFALNFPEPVWISCEIAQIKEVRGNYYLDLIEQDAKDDVIAQASAVIWFKSFLFLKSKLGAMTNSILQAGIDIRVKVKIDFNERYGYKLIIEDIDPAYTVGKLELARQNIIERLKKEEVWGLNKNVELPSVIQRIALISSDKAAGYADFVSQLNNNPYGYAYKLTLFQSSMQGQNTERDVSNALDEIKENALDYDAIVIIRGGGSKMDLSFFDNFNIGYKISTSPLPVITGIGHEIDESIADMTACLSLKTPTACAAWLVDKSMLYESNMQELFSQIERFSKILMEQKKGELNNATDLLVRIPRDKISNQRNQLFNTESLLKTMVVFKLRNERQFLESAVLATHIADPINVLLKGYSIVRQNGKVVERAEQYKSHSKTSITFSDATIDLNNK